MKERFSRLLLGEDMSGSGKGVCTAVAISNAITNLYGIYLSLSLFLCISPPTLSLSLCLTFFIMECSFCVWSAAEVRATASWEKDDVEERNELSIICVWLHTRIQTFIADIKRWDYFRGMYA